MLDRFYEKNFILIVNVLGFITILLGGILLLLNGWFDEGIGLESIIQGVSFIVFLMMMLGGFFLFHNQSKLSWILVVLTFSFLVVWNIFSILFYIELILMLDSPLGMITTFSFDPYEEIRSCLFRMSFLLLPIAILNNKIFIEKFEIYLKVALISILSGVLICSFLMVLEFIVLGNSYMDFY